MYDKPYIFIEKYNYCERRLCKFQKILNINCQISKNIACQKCLKCISGTLFLKIFDNIGHSRKIKNVEYDGFKTN